MPVDGEHVRFVFARLRRELSKLASEPQARDIHDFRTYSRRLQTLMGELSSAPGRNEKRLLKSLARLRRRAGRVRDLDVQLAALRALKTAQEPRRKTELASVLAENRRQQEKRWHKALDRKSLRELRRRLKKAESGLRLRRNTDPLRLAVRRFASASRDKGPITEEILHAYRMSAKRARYLAEFAPNSAKREQLIRRLRRVQDALGDWHDWLVLTLSAEKRFGGVQDSSLVAALRNLTGAKFRHAVQVLSTVRGEIPGEGVVARPARSSEKPEATPVAAPEQRAA